VVEEPIEHPRLEACLERELLIERFVVSIPGKVYSSAAVILLIRLSTAIAS
jgi:hypothetical protein